MNETKEREQLYLYGPEKTVSDDPTKFFRHMQRYMLAMIHATALEKRDVYVDYGCGSGYGTELISVYFDRSIGLDICPEAVEYAKRTHNRGGTTLFTNSVAFEGFKPDFITCIEVLEHLGKTQAEHLIAQFGKILDPDGSLVITTPCPDPDGKPNPHHLHEYGPDDLYSLLSKHFREVEVEDISLGLLNVIAVCRGPKG